MQASLESVLKRFVIAWWMMGFLALVCTFTLEGSLPEQLRDYRDFTYEQSIGALEVVFLLTALILTIIALISSIGIFRLKPESRNIFAILNIIILIFCVFLGPVVEHAVTMEFIYIGNLLTGSIIALTMFTGVLKSRVSKKN